MTLEGIQCPLVSCLVMFRMLHGFWWRQPDPSTIKVPSNLLLQGFSNHWWALPTAIVSLRAAECRFSNFIIPSTFISTSTIWLPWNRVQIGRQDKCLVPSICSNIHSSDLGDLSNKCLKWPVKLLFKLSLWTHKLLYIWCVSSHRSLFGAHIVPS